MKKILKLIKRGRAKPIANHEAFYTTWAESVPETKGTTFKVLNPPSGGLEKQREASNG